MAEEQRKTAFKKLYEQYYTPIYRFLAARTPSKQEAEDIVQAIFTKIWCVIRDSLVTDKLPAAYMYTLARNALIDHWRKRKHEHLDEEAEELLPDTRQLITDVIAIQQEVRPALEAIAALPQDQRQVLMLRFFDELETAEIAELLGKNEAAVRQTQCRALKAVRKELSKGKTPA